MKFKRMIRALDVHAAGWPLRVVFGGLPEKGRETLSETAERLWESGGASVRWLQREPRGHAAMRIGVVAVSGNADAALLVFDSEGPCRADEMDALCAAAAMTETGAFPGAAPLALETTGRTMRIDAADESGWRGADCRTLWRPEERGGQGEITAAGASTAAAFAADNRYAIRCASSLSVPIRAEQASRLEGLMRAEGSGGLTPVIIEQEGNVVVTLGRNGRLLRAPEAGAVGAVLAMQRERESRLEQPVRFRGLSGGIVEGSVLSAERGDGATMALRWKLRARARLTGSCEFVLDPADPFEEGFLLR